MNFRVVVLEADVTGAEIVDAIRGITGPVAGQGPVPRVREIAAPVAVGETAPENQKAKVKSQKAKVGEAVGRPVRTGGTGVSNLVRQALREGPKTAAQVRDWLQSHGHGPVQKNVAQVIWTLIKQGEAERGPDGVCRLL